MAVICASFSARAKASARSLSRRGKTRIGRDMAADRGALGVAHEKNHRRLGRGAGGQKTGKEADKETQVHRG